MGIDYDVNNATSGVFARLSRPESGAHDGGGSTPDPP
jgi:hypothetical protein